MQPYLHHLLTDLQAATENLPITPGWYENPYPVPVPKYILEWEQAPFVPFHKRFAKSGRFGKSFRCQKR